MNSMPENISGYVLFPVLLLNFVVSPSKSIKCSSILHLLPDFNVNCHSEIVL